MEKITPEIQNKIIEEWKKIVSKHIEHSESSKIAWVEFSRKIEKEYGLTAWQVWELVRGKETTHREQGKWYNKQIGNLTLGNLLAVLSFGFSIIFYLIQKNTDSNTAKFLSFFLFSHSIGEYVGDKIKEKFGEKYSSKNNSLFVSLFIIICVIFLSILGNSNTTELISVSVMGFGLGEIIGFETRKLKTIGLID